MFKGTKPGKLDDFERQYADPDRPGHVRVGFWPQPSGIVNALAKLGYRDDLGRPLARFLPLPLTPDPAYVSVSEAPEDKRRRLAEAEEAKAAWQRRRSELFEAGVRATAKWKSAARERDAKTYNAGLAEELQVAEQLRNHEAKLPSIQIELGEAQADLRRWFWEKRGVRYGYDVSMKETPTNF